jgi:uncharacterized membrane protein
VSRYLAFLWCGSLVSTMLLSPVGAWLLLTEPIPSVGWWVVMLGAGLEALYYWTLAQAYRYGDLSLVYPIARGTAPILVLLLAMVFLGERPSGLAVVGIGLVVIGTVVIHVRQIGAPSLGAAAVLGQLGTRYALLTGLVIAAYSALDKYGVSLVTPILYGYLLFAGLTVVLLALTLAPVSYVAAAREVSVVLAAVLGAVVLHEGYGRQRLVGSVAIAAGLMLLVLG